MNQEPLLTPTEVKFILWAIAALFAILITVFSFSGKLIVGYLKSMASSMNKMEKDLSVLANDHSNLKEDHIELKERVHDLEQKMK